MRKDLEYLKLIEKYLKGELSDKEKAEFETKMQSSEKLRKDVEAQKEWIETERPGIWPTGYGRSFFRVLMICRMRERL